MTVSAREYVQVKIPVRGYVAIFEVEWPIRAIRCATMLRPAPSSISNKLQKSLPHCVLHSTCSLPGGALDVKLFVDIEMVCGDIGGYVQRRMRDSDQLAVKSEDSRDPIAMNTKGAEAILEQFSDALYSGSKAFPRVLSIC